MRYLLFIILFCLSAFIVEAAPTASISCPATAFVGEPIICDGSASTNVNGQVVWSTQTFTDGVAPVAMDFGDGLGRYSKAEILKAAHVYKAAGTYTVSLTVLDAARASASTTTSITISDIPAATGGAIQTLTDQGTNNANCTALQTAINTALAANTVEQEIRLPALTYTCVITPPAAAGTKYVTIRPTDTSWLPGPLVRLTTATASSMPKIVSPGTDQTPFIINGTGRGFLRLLGIEFGRQPTGHLYQLAEIGGNGSSSTDATMPRNIIFDRCYFHGVAFQDTVRGVFAIGNSISFINNYFVDFHDTGADSQSVDWADGTGHGFVNNYGNSYGENVMWGGADASRSFQATCAAGGTTTGCVVSSTTGMSVGMGISLVVGGARNATTASIIRSISGSTITWDAIAGAPDTTANAVRYGGSPVGIFVAHNYFYKNPIYFPLSPSYNGSYSPVVKNLFELKHVYCAVIVGNYFSVMWGGYGQAGQSFLFTPQNQGGSNPWATTRDVQFSDNFATNIPDGPLIQGGSSDNLSGRVQYLTIRNNVMEINRAAWNGSNGGAIFFSSSNFINGFVGTKNVTITHNTFANVDGNLFVLSTGAPGTNTLVVNNIGEYRNYGFFGDGGVLGDAAITQYMPDGFFRYNVLSDDIGQKGPTGASWTAPRGAPNYFPATIDTGTFIDRSAGNYRLAASSPYKAGNATPAADGTDIGANFDDVSSATLNSITGNWAGSGGSGAVCRWNTNPACSGP